MGNKIDKETINKIKRLSSNEKLELKKCIERENGKKVCKAIFNVLENNMDMNKDETLLVAAIRIHNLKAVRYLIESGIDVNESIEKDCEEYSPLMEAVSEGQKEIVRLLLCAGADANFVNKNKKSALSEAAFKSNLEIVQLLLTTAGVDLNICGGNSLLVAASVKSVEVVSELINSGICVNFCFSEKDRWTALHYACSFNNSNNSNDDLNDLSDSKDLSLVRFLLESGR